MKNTIKTFFVMLSVAVLQVQSTFAFSRSIQDGVEAARGDNQPTDLFGVTGVFTTVSNTLLFIIGAVAVIMIIIGGLRYITSGGDQNNITSAKNTILYALVGVIVAILAYAIVSFIVSSLAAGGAVGGTNV